MELIALETRGFQSLKTAFSHQKHQQSVRVNAVLAASAPLAFSMGRSYDQSVCGATWPGHKNRKIAGQSESRGYLKITRCLAFVLRFSASFDFSIDWWSESTST